MGHWLEILSRSQNGEERLDVVRDPTLEGLREWINRLDGVELESVSIYLGDESGYMGIVAGEDGATVVAGRLASAGPFIFASGPASNETVYVDVGG